MDKVCKKNIYLVVPAGGVGNRFGGMKQYADIGGRALVQVTVSALQNTCKELGIQVLGTYVAAPENEVERLQDMLPDAKVVVGGASRAESVARAFFAIQRERGKQTEFVGSKDGTDYGGASDIGEAIDKTTLTDNMLVAVHDACRPFVSVRLMATLLDALEYADCSVPSLPVTDTLKKRSAEENDTWKRNWENMEKAKGESEHYSASEYHFPVCTVPREQYFTVQTPQVMKYIVAEKLYGQRSLSSRLTDDSMMAEELGYQIEYVTGDALNIKITTADDLVLARGIFANRPMNLD